MFCDMMLMMLYDSLKLDKLYVRPILQSCNIFHSSWKICSNTYAQGMLIHSFIKTPKLQLKIMPFDSVLHIVR